MKNIKAIAQGGIGNFGTVGGNLNLLQFGIGGHVLVEFLPVYRDERGKYLLSGFGAAWNTKAGTKTAMAKTDLAIHGRARRRA